MRKMAAPLIGCLLALSVVPPVFAQDVPNTQHSAVPSSSPAPEAESVDHRVKIGFAGIGDYTMFSQTPTSVSQVGTVASQADLRAARVVLTQNISKNFYWYFAPNYNGFVTPPDQLFSIYDLYLAYKSPIGLLTIGKQKETFVYEMAALAANLPQQERVLSPFFSSRAVGVKLTNTALGQRMTWALGWYPFYYDGSQTTARLTGVPYITGDNAEWVHLGVDYRYVGNTYGKLRFRGKPESDIAPNFVDTGSFTGNYANELNYELVATTKPISLYSEFSKAWVNAPLSQNPVFFGYYAELAWAITGETRRTIATLVTDCGSSRKSLPDGRKSSESCG